MGKREDKIDQDRQDPPHKPLPPGAIPSASTDPASYGTKWTTLTAGGLHRAPLAVPDTA
jgi:hypothetical protein